MLAKSTLCAHLTLLVPLAPQPANDDPVLLALFGLARLIGLQAPPRPAKTWV